MPAPRKTTKASAASSGEVSKNDPVVASTPSPELSSFQYTVNFSDSVDDQALLTEIEETLSRQKSLEFSDLCKEALQQLLAPVLPPLPTVPEKSESSLVEQLQARILALETKIASLSEISRLEQLESLVISLEQRLESLGTIEPAIAEPTQDSSGTLTTASPENPPVLDPLLSHLSSLLEDF